MGSGYAWPALQRVARAGGMTNKGRRGCRWRTLLATLRPAALGIDRRERWRVTVGVGIGLLACGGLSLVLGRGAVWLVAPMGASAVILFALPSSPLAQPWSVVGGNTLSALVSIAVASAMPSSAWPAATPALAAAAAIGAMLMARCLHPPGGAVALTVALGGVADWRFAFFPVFTNSLLLAAAAVAYNRATGKAYPHQQDEPKSSGAAGRFTDADIDRVLARYNQVLDVPRDELHALLEAAESEAYRRRLGELCCADIMSSDVVSVKHDTPLADAWLLLREHRIKALPVVDGLRRVVGVVTQADFLRRAEIDSRGRRFAHLSRPKSPVDRGDDGGPEVVSQIMTRRVQVASAGRSLASLIPVFASTGHHHVPVVDGQLRLVGILTQTDLVRALLATG